MTEYLASVVEGALGTEAIIISAKAGGAIDLWAPVIISAGPSAPDPITVTTTTTAYDNKVIGVVVGPKLASGKAADAAGTYVNVCVFGQCKVKVLGKTVNIALGDGLSTSTTAGKAVKTDITFAVTYAAADAETQVLKALSQFARALLASTADDDIIPCFVRQAGGATA